MRKRLRLEWSAYARADREAIFDYIEADSPQAAITIDRRIGTQIATLAKFPQSGRLGRIEGTREVVIQRTPYIAVYSIVSGTVRILRVLHGVQRWPDEMTEMQPE
jgi:toxin ParE1/3/4